MVGPLRIVLSRSPHRLRGFENATSAALFDSSGSRARPAAITPAHSSPSVVTAVGPLSDLSTGANATDGARAQVYAVAPGNGNTYVYLILTGLDPAGAGTTYGAHVHIGPAWPATAPWPSGTTTRNRRPSEPQNEVWLDFTVRPGGVGVSQATVPFEIAPSTAGSVVIHANATQVGTGIAGGRIVCLPVAF